MGSGQPFDEQAKRRLLFALKDGDSLNHAAIECGFSVQTVRKHIKADPEFAQEVADAVGYADGKMQRHLYKTIMAEDSISGMFRWLESRQPHEFGQKKLVVNQHVGPGGGPIQVAVASTDSLRELLSDDNYRDKMLAMVHDLPMIDTTARELEA